MKKRRKYRYQKSYRIKRKKPIFKKGFFWPGFLALLCLGGLSYFFFFSSFFQIKEINIEGEQKVSREDILAGIEGEIGKKILFFKTKSVFLVNAAQIREALFAAYPPIAGIAFERQLPDSLNVRITEREARAIWCREECYLMDSRGIIFEKAGLDSPDLVRVIVSEYPQETGLGERAVEEEPLSIILEIESKLKDKTGLKIEEAKAISAERIDFKTDEGWEIYFNAREDINWQITKLDLVLEKEISPEKREQLDYIDLRFTRVYYK
jgi:cell division septal protein FtsQ